jgi:adenylate cyclase
LEPAGFNLWYDDGIHVGSVWRQALADALSKSVGLIFFSTEKSTESSNCLKELNFILDEEKPVFVVQMDDTPLPSLLRLALSDRQSLVKSEYSEEGFRTRLVSALSTVVPPAVRVASGEAPASDVGEIETDPPSIAILPLTCLGSDVELKYLAEGLTGDLIARLSQRIWHIVSGQVDDVSLEPKEVGERRGVRYLLGGSVQRSGDRFRLVTRLTDAASGQEIWAQRYERSGDDLLETQDQLVNSVDFEIFDVIMTAEDNRLRDLPDAELDAWGLCARTRSMQVIDRATRDRMRSLLEQAVSRDPNFAFAHSLFGIVLAEMIYNQFSRNAEEDSRLAVQQVDQALALAPNNMVIMDMASFVHGQLGDLDHALYLAERVSQMGGRPWPSQHNALIKLGRYEEALILGREHPDSVDLLNMVTASMTLALHEEALDWARQATTEQPKYFLNWAALACVQAALGRDEKARESFARAKAIVPTLTADRYEKGMRLAWRNREDLVEANVASLRLLNLD